MFKKKKKLNSKERLNDQRVDIDFLIKMNNKDVNYIFFWDIMYPINSVLTLLIVVFNILLERYNTQMGLLLFIGYILMLLLWIVGMINYFTKGRRKIKERIDFRNKQIEEIKGVE